ncbi:nuclear transport factor 2 family protein [Flavobacterium granuli]|uniref:Ketosteroid isomerase-like protein n=1 Tax=Flavobacterium granuli TaxID=280093 RepID=A0ABU1S8F2_9FLAO|nr:nuclear transport factor 2 family protein [Flavobacterium granuli]MDR6846560.1 ketosteroid isomerase-like protein [Flavobacterium granuli]
MKKNVLVVCCFFLIISCKKEESKEIDEAVISDDSITNSVEFADSKYAEIGKKTLAAMEKGDMDSWMGIYADSAVYVWNSGDSLVGKPAIASYWKQRRANVIETIKFSDAIFLPILVNEPQSVEAKGVWLLSWYKTTAKYRNGKEMTQWIHTDYHFDSHDKVDRVVQYIDKAAINAALPK